MIFLRHTKLFFLLSCSLFFISGCVSIDPRTSHEKISIEATSNLNGIFENRSGYQSQGLNVFSSQITLAELLGLDNAKKATDVELIFEEGRTLRIKFLVLGKLLLSKDYVAGTDLRIDNGGKIEVWRNRNCGLDKGAGLGCEKRSITLFINTAGDLVCNISGGGAGLIFLVIPVGGYKEEMTIHHRLVQ